jgi:hypothetical protein
VLRIFAGRAFLALDCRLLPPKDEDLHSVDGAMDCYQSGDTACEHARGCDECDAQPAGWIEAAMPMKDDDDVSAQVGEGCPLRELSVDGLNHCHLEQATADGAHETSRATNQGQLEQGHSNLPAIRRLLK